MTSLLANATHTASDVTGVLDIRYDKIAAATFLLDVTAAGSLPGDKLDVYLQQGVASTWDDFVHWTQVLGNGGAKQHLATWSGLVAPETEIRQPQDAAIGAGVLQGPVAGRWRLKWVITNGGGTHTFDFSVSMAPIIHR